MNPIAIHLYILISWFQIDVSQCQYEDYFKNISVALSEKYANDDWEEVNGLIKTAVTKVDFSCGKDLEEALQVSLKVNDDVFTKQIIKKLLEGGIPVEYFKRYQELDNQGIMKEALLEYVKEERTTSSFNLELKKELRALRFRDSMFNVEYHQFRRGEKALTSEYLIQEATDIVQHFRFLVEKYGFPSERNTGYFYANGKIQNSPLQVVLIHIHQTGEYIIRNDFSYEDLVCEGHLSEFQYHSLIDTNSFGGGQGVEHEMTLFYEQHKGGN